MDGTIFKHGNGLGGRASERRDDVSLAQIGSGVSPTRTGSTRGVSANRRSLRVFTEGFSDLVLGGFLYTTGQPDQGLYFSNQFARNRRFDTRRIEPITGWRLIITELGPE